MVRCSVLRMVGLMLLVVWLVVVVMIVLYVFSCCSVL